jgi:aquaglyceroporin related protein
MRMRRTGTTGTTRTNQTGGLLDASERAGKKTEQTTDIDNEYFALNPWYNQQKEKPVFGMASPLPRTVRRGMYWGKGRKSLYKVDEDEEQNKDGVDRHDGLEFQKDLGKFSPIILDVRQNRQLTSNLEDLDEDSEDTQWAPDPDQQQQPSEGRDPDHVQTTIEGRRVNMKRVPTAEAEQLRGQHNSSRGSNHEGGRERAPVNEHGLTYNKNDNDNNNNNNSESGATQRNHFGLQDGLPPLQELDSHEATQSEQEDEEIQKREHEAQQDYYNQYRNPIARLRAQYPQASAEFLATFIYLFLGICVNLSVATSDSMTGSFETQAWGWGFAVMIGIYLAGGVSGAHLSPTISISLTVYRGFPWRMAVVYICMQMLAGLAAGALAYG